MLKFILFSMMMTMMIFIIFPVLIETESYLNPKFKRNPSLRNYWPFESNVSDLIGGAHLFGGYNATLTANRFNQPMSALDLNNGYYKMPQGVYFNGSGYTVMAWVYMRKFQSDSASH